MGTSFYLKVNVLTLYSAHLMLCGLGFKVTFHTVDEAYVCYIFSVHFLKIRQRGISMIELIATAESVDQAKALIATGVDTLYIGEEPFGLRLPASFTHEEIEEMTQFAHQHGRKVHVA